MTRTSITVDEATKERHAALKQEGETWDEFENRLADALEQADDVEDDAGPDFAVVENVDEIARAAADEVENRMTRR